MKQLKTLLALGFLTSAISANVFAHANFVPPGVEGSREYPEGKRQFLRLNLAHDCGHGEVHNPTIATVAIFPNGIDAIATIGTKQVNLVDYLYTSNPYVPGSSHYSAPAIFGIKPSVDADWNKTIVSTYNTLPYYNHGVRGEDVSHIQWLGGYVPNETMENLEFVATFPKFTNTRSDGMPNCVSSMRLYIPAIQYCTNGAINAWLLGEPVGPLADAIAVDTEDLISNSGTYAPYVDVVRSNPRDPSCKSEEKLILYPSVDAVIEAQLEWNAKKAKKMMKKAGIKRTHIRQ